MVAILKNLFKRAEKFTTADGLVDFLSSRSAFVSQKCTYEYCRARSGLMWDKLMLEREFLDAMEICRWQALADVYADLAVLAEAWMRPSLQDEAAKARIADFLVARGRDFLESFPEPAHRMGQGWGKEMAELRTRLAAMQLAAPKAPQEVAHVAGNKVYDIMPIHTNFKNFDRELVVNSVRFQFVRVYEDMSQLGIRDQVVADILHPAGA